MAFFSRWRRQLLISLVFVALLSVFAVSNPRTFGSLRIYRSFMSTIPVTLILTLGMTMLIVAGDMDMSFPSVSAAGAYVFAYLYAKAGYGAPSAMMVALAAGAVMGLLNGLLVVYVEVPSIIATIGTQFLWRGLILLLSDGTAIPLPSLKEGLLHFMLAGRIGSWGIPSQALWGLALTVVFALLLNRHVFGDALRFIGDNRSTAEMMGIPVKRVRTGAFVMMGVLSAFAGLLATFELNNWWPTQGEGYMLLVFASVFVGGTSAYGGEGTVYGSFVGSIVIGIIEAGIVSAGLTGFWTRFVHGIVIIASVSFYALLSRRRR